YIAYCDSFEIEDANRDRKKFFDEAAEMFAEKYGGGSSTGTTELRLGDHPGREYRYPNMRIQVYLAEKSLYLVAVNSNRGGSMSSNFIDEYFRSFRLLAQPDERVRYLQR
ncbi:MAG: hypothetical protein N2C14_24100, partial [Planctomycetales bacterium]